MENRLYFSELARTLGIAGGEMPAMDGHLPEPKPGEHMNHPNVWRKEGGEKLMAYLKEHFAPGDRLEYDGHGDCWMMLAMMYQMRQCRLFTYIGVFDKSLQIEAYQVGGDEKENQPCTFTLEEQGDDVLLTVHLKPEGGPFDMPFREIVAPEIPKGKNIFVRLDGRHLLFTFPLSLNYGDSCRSLVMDYAGECFVSLSNTPELQMGDLVENPFS